MISLPSSAQAEIKQALHEFIQQNADVYPVLTGYKGSVYNQAVDMLSGFASFLAYKYLASWREVNLSTCTSREAAYVNAYEIGYNVTRSTAPKLSIAYTGVSRFLLVSGHNFGSFESGGVSLDVVYFGPTQSVFPGDEIVVHLAKYFREDGDFTKYDFNKPVFLDIKVQDGYSLDEKAYAFHLKGLPQTVSDDPEDFVIRHTPVAITKPRSQLVYGLGLELRVSQNMAMYGVPLVKQDTYSFEYLATLGQIQGLEETVLSALTLEGDFEYVSTLTEGSDSESLEQVKALAPLFYMTARRAVTPPDYEVILKKDPYLLDAKYYGYNENTRAVRIAYVSSSGVALTNFEKTQVQENIDRKGVAGVGIELLPATIKPERFLVQVLYDCESKKATDSLISMEDLLKVQILEILNGPSGKLGISFTQDELKSKINRLTLLEQSVIKSCTIRRINSDNTVSTIPEGYVFVAAKTEAFNLTIQLELSC